MWNVVALISYSSQKRILNQNKESCMKLPCHTNMWPFHSFIFSYPETAMVKKANGEFTSYAVNSGEIRYQLLSELAEVSDVAEINCP